MKNKLAIFDVDFTIKEHHGDGSKDGVFRSPLGFAKLFPNSLPYLKKRDTIALSLL